MALALDLQLQNIAVYVTAGPMMLEESDAWVVNAVVQAELSQVQRVSELVRRWSNVFDAAVDEFGLTLSQQLVAANVNWQDVHDTFALTSFAEVQPSITTTVETTPGQGVPSTPALPRTTAASPGGASPGGASPGGASAEAAWKNTVMVVLVIAVVLCATLMAGFAVRRLLRRRKSLRAPMVMPPPTGCAPRGPEEESHGPVAGTVDPSSARALTDPPGYWRHQDMTAEVMARVDVSMDVRLAMQNLVDSTFKRVTTRDRRGGPMPAGLRIRQVQRVENSGVWFRFARERLAVRAKRTFRCTPVSAVVGDGLRTAPEGGQALEDRCVAAGNATAPDSLHRGINEVHLWHGTSPKRALSILRSGFQLKYAGSGAGSSMYGDGVYLAECSSKADEYAQDDPEEQAGIFCLLLCRVVLGEVLKLTTGGEATHAMIKAAMESGAYDSVLGDRELSVGTYREFIVYKEAQVYPEYLVLYSREAEAASTGTPADPDAPAPDPAAPGGCGPGGDGSSSAPLPTRRGYTR